MCVVVETAEEDKTEMFMNIGRSIETVREGRVVRRETSCIACPCRPEVASLNRGFGYAEYGMKG